MERFFDRVAVVTGSGSGIGRALAHSLAARGCNLALADIDADGLAETARQVEATGRRVTTHEVDVSDRARMEAFAQQVEQAHGRADILINNAGVTVSATLEEQSLDDFAWVVGVNLWGVVHGCKMFLPLLRRQDEASIVNLSSMFGLIGVPRQTSYCATKFAVRGFSEALAVELAKTSVRVMSVHPGGIRTNIAKSARYRGDSVRTRDKTVAFFERRAMSPRRAAEQIVDGIAQGSERLLVTREAQVTDMLKRVWPELPSRWLAWVQDRVLG
ncbi:MAG: SDR family oxidoreductase [Deltaproteobacteria bacterium]|nr:SDR family oxidoreductase [Deltaproteobacteria bacterium]